MARLGRARARRLVQLAPIAAAVDANPAAGLASGTGAAFGPAVSVAAPADAAAGIGAAQAPTTAVSVNAGLASGTGAALAPSVSTGSTTTVNAGLASGAGTAFGVTTSIAPQAGAAAGTGSALAPSVGAKATAGLAAGTGAANNPTITTVQVVPWATRLLTASTSAAVWVAIGDSITEGADATNHANRWTERALAAFRSYAGISGGGRGYVPPEYRITLGGAGVTQSGTNSPVTTMGFGWRGQSLGASGSVTWTVTGTSADIWWRRSAAGGSFTWRIDAGGTTTINTAGGDSWQRTTVTLGSSGSHTVTVARTAGTPVVGGLMVYDGDATAGVQLYDGGSSGIRSDQYIGAAAFDGATPEYALFKAALAVIQPDLVSIFLGVNDSLQGGSPTPAQCGANLTTLVTDLQALAKPPHIVLIASYTQPTGTTWSSYVTQIGAAAAARNVTFLDLSALMPSGTSTTYYTDQVHPNDSGHALLASYFTSGLDVDGRAVTPAAATGAGAALTPTVSVKTNAGAATGTGTAGTPAPAVAPAAGAATGTGAALAPTTSVRVNAGLASGVGTAYAPTASVPGATNALAGLASGVGTANTPAPSVSVNAGVAAGTGTALAPTAQTASTTTVNAGLASGIGTALGGVVKIWVSAGVAAGTGTAYPAIIPGPGDAIVNAGVATGVGTAYGAIAMPALDYPLRAGVPVDHTIRLHAGIPT